MVTDLPDWISEARIFAAVAHVGPAAKVPTAPSWPPLTMEAEAPLVVNAEPADASMRVSYFAGMVEHLLRERRHPNIAAIATFPEIGAVGTNWPPRGLAVKFTDGNAAFISFMGTAGKRGNDTTRPATFEPEAVRG